MSMTTELAQRMEAAALKAKHAGEAQIMPFDTRISALNEFQLEACPVNVLALVEALEAKEQQRAAANKVVNQQDIELQELRQCIAELEAKDINVKRQAQALFDAIQNPGDAYIPAYVRCLSNALAGVAVDRN